MQNSAVRRPEREPVIEASRNLVLELDRPGGAAVQCLVNTEISRVIPSRLPRTSFSISLTARELNFTL